MNEKEKALEIAALRDAIADITIAWGHLENSLTAMLSECLGLPEDFSMASAIFFAPTGLDARLAIAARALSVAISKLPGSEDVSSAAHSLFSRLNSKKTTRNTVAHGTITSVGLHGKEYIRLTPPIFDRQKMGKDSRKGQVPGLSAHDIKNSAASVLQLAGRAIDFGVLIRSFRQNDAKTYSEVRARLIGQDAPTPPTPPGTPAPPEATAK